MLKEHLDEFIIVYLNNIIIYLDLEEEYKKYVKWVLKKTLQQKYTHCD